MTPHLKPENDWLGATPVWDEECSIEEYLETPDGHQWRLVRVRVGNTASRLCILAPDAERVKLANGEMLIRKRDIMMGEEGWTPDS